MSFSTLFVFIGLAGLGVGIYTFFRQRSWLAHATVTTGTVTALIPVRVQGKYVIIHGENGTQIEQKYHYRSEVTFKAQNKWAVKFIASISARPSRHAIGDKVEVAYNPQDPKDAKINQFLDLWFSTLMMVGFGLFFIGMGILGMIVQGG